MQASPSSVSSFRRDLGRFDRDRRESDKRSKGEVKRIQREYEGNVGGA